MHKVLNYLFLLGLMSLVLGFLVSESSLFNGNTSQSIVDNKGTAVNAVGDVNYNQSTETTRKPNIPYSPSQVKQEIKGNTGLAINAGVIVTVIQQSSEYHALRQEVDKAKQRSQRHPEDLALSVEWQEAQTKLDNFQSEILKIAEDMNKTPFDSQRGRKAKEYVDQGNYQAARETLNAQSMGEEQQALLSEQQHLQEKQADNIAKLKELAEEFILKARLTAVDYKLGDRRIAQTSEYFEQALKSGRTPERLFIFAGFLQDNNQYAEAEKLYRETLTAYRDLARSNPAVYAPYVAGTLNNLGVLVENDEGRGAEAETLLREALS